MWPVGRKIVAGKPIGGEAVGVRILVSMAVVQYDCHKRLIRKSTFFKKNHVIDSGKSQKLCDRYHS